MSIATKACARCPLNRSAPAAAAAASGSLGLHTVANEMTALTMMGSPNALQCNVVERNEGSTVKTRRSASSRMHQLPGYNGSCRIQEALVVAQDSFPAQVDFSGKIIYSSAAVKKRAVGTRKRGAGCVEGCHRYPPDVLFSSTAVEAQQNRDLGCRSRRWFVNEYADC
jgi:hypothetical protein